MRTPAGIVRVWRGLPDKDGKFCGKFCGTAFFVEPRRVLTAAHVAAVPPDEPLFVFVGWNGGYFARVVSRLRHDDWKLVDVALLAVDEQSAAPTEALVPVGDPLPIAIGTPLEIVGFADAHTAVERRPVTVTSLEGASTAAIVQPLPARGMSGGPAVSPDGFLRGIIWARDVDKGRGYITPFSTFRAFLAAQKDRGAGCRPAVQGAGAAKAADAERLRLARGLLLTWRQAYGLRAEELTAAAAKARALRKDPPATVGADVAALIGLGAEVARDLRELPVGPLEFAGSSGLNVHPTVFRGQALTDVAGTNATYGPNRPQHMRVYEEELVARGLNVPVPNAYAYEMLERVFRSAAGLVRFAPKDLPLGYISRQGTETAKDLSDAGPLLLMDVGDGPSLKLLELGAPPRPRGSFVARRGPLHVHAAQRMTDGTLDILGSDFQHVYRWSASNSTPIADYPRSDIRAAAFASSQPGVSPVVVTGEGEVRELFLDGSSSPLLPSLGESCAAAVLWQDPLDVQARRLLRLSEAGMLSSDPLGSEGESSSTNLMACLPDGDDLGKGRLLLSGRELHISEFEGFPCIVASLSSGFLQKSVVHFLDPMTLRPIRQACRFGDGWAEFRLALGRYLVATRSGWNTPRPLLAMWDLVDPRADPTGQWCVEAGGVYEPLVVPAGPDEFHVYFTLHLLASDQEYYLCRFHFPSRDVERLLKCPNIRTYPVSEAHDSEMVDAV